MNVSELIMQRVEPTLALAVATLIITLLVAIPLGVIAAYRQGGWIDRVVMGFSVAGFSVPVFVLGYLLIYVFAVELKRSEEHTSELQSLMRISYAVFCLKKKKNLVDHKT